MAKMAQIIPMVADSEAAAKSTADGATAGANDGPDEVAGRHPRQYTAAADSYKIAIFYLMYLLPVLLHKKTFRHRSSGFREI